MEGIEAPPSQADFEKMVMSMTSELGMSSNQLKSMMSKEMYDDVIRIASNPIFQKSIDDTCASNGSQTGGAWFKYVKAVLIALLLAQADAGAAQAGVYRRAAQLRQQRLANRAPGSQQGGKNRRTKKHRSRRHSRKH